MLRNCPKCGFGNDDGRLYCSECDSLLGNPQEKQHRDNELPPRKKDLDTGKIIMIVIVVVCVCPLLIVIPYYWVTHFADTSFSYTTTYGLHATDAKPNATGGFFNPGNEIIQIKHLTGQSINWSRMIKMTCQIIGQDAHYNLFLKSVRGVIYLNNSANAVSTPEDDIILALGSGSIPAGSHITVDIVGKNAEWRSPSGGFEVK